MCDLWSRSYFERKRRTCAEKNRLAKGALRRGTYFRRSGRKTLKLGERFRGYIGDTAELLNSALDEGKFRAGSKASRGRVLDIDPWNVP